MDAQFLSEAALQALRDSHRDAAWVASATLENAMHRALEDGFGAAMDLANKAIRVRDAIAARIAMLEPEIGKAIAVKAMADREQSVQALH